MHEIVDAGSGGCVGHKEVRDRAKKMARQWVILSENFILVGADYKGGQRGDTVVGGVDLAKVMMWRMDWTKRRTEEVPSS